MEDLKAQLAVNTFSDMIDTSTLEIKESMNENIKEIAQAIEASGGIDWDAWQNYDFSIALDNYSTVLLGESQTLQNTETHLMHATINLIRENANFDKICNMTYKFRIWKRYVSRRLCKSLGNCPIFMIVVLLGAMLQWEWIMNKSGWIIRCSFNCC